MALNLTAEGFSFQPPLSGMRTMMALNLAEGACEEKMAGNRAQIGKCNPSS